MLIEKQLFSILHGGDFCRMLLTVTDHFCVLVFIETIIRTFVSSVGFDMSPTFGNQRNTSQKNSSVCHYN